MSIHDPRTWYWPEGMPISLQGGLSPAVKASVPDKRDNRDPEELGSEVIVRAAWHHNADVPKDEQLDFGNEQLKGFDA